MDPAAGRLAVVARSVQERIALLLRADESTGSFSAETSRPAAGVSLSVDGIGPVTLPIGAPQERALVSVARPAMFGLGEETLTDTSVRDTWELAAGQVSLGGEWGRVLDEVLVEVHEDLGLPTRARLRAELHALLVYGPDQFFAPHQDSEKHDEMVATLVVSLPSVHTGGELVVTHGGEARTYRHIDRSSIGFVAFYADCVHEVKPVRSGRRVTLTFNLLVTREAEETEPDPDEELARLIGEHFATPMAPRWSTEETTIPNRLVVLLDHQYSERGLTAGHLKGTDVEWVSRVQAAAGRVGCVSALALGEVHQTWEAGEIGRSWRYRYDDDEACEGHDDGGASYDVGELIEDETNLGWWKRTGTDGGERISLLVDQREVCAITPTASLTPHTAEYEGYMGNYGNTLDRWYRRAAIVLWPMSRDFVARAEADLPAAIAELDGRLSGGDDLDRARADARELVDLIRAPGLLGPLLSVGNAVDDPELAYALLSRLGGEELAAEHAAALAEITQRYGDHWTGRLIESWFPIGRYRTVSWGWVTDSLPDLAPALRKASAGSVIGEVCRRLWASMSILINLALGAGPQSRAAGLVALVDPAAAIFGVIEEEMVEEFAASLAAPGDGVLDLMVPLSRRLGAAAPASLVDEATRRLESLLGAAPRSADDWSIVWSGCGCDLCVNLQRFLADRDAVVLDWPLRADRRQHVHRCIDSAELPVSHRTVRKGSPYTLRLVKQPDLHKREVAQRRQAATDLAWLRGEG